MAISRKKSGELFDRAKELFPGGVNSPVRAFKSVDGVPLFIKKGDGCHIWDEDGNQFIDFCCSWGPLILGHNNAEVKSAIESALANGTSFGAPTELENKLGSLILDRNPFIDKIRFVSSGTEAVMSGIRLARGFTGRDKIVKFDGCYHGHADSLLVKAGSGLATFGTSSSAGVPDSFSAETIVLPLNDEEALQACMSQHGAEIACIIIEPVPANNGLLLQDKSFLELLRSVCTEQGILLFFDEVISGFRVAFSGAAEHYGIKPDIITYGKIIGGGLPVGAYGASDEIMSHISPLGDVYQAGTLSGNPVAMAAGYAQLTACAREGFYEDQEQRTEAFVNQIMKHVRGHNYKFEMFSIASIFWFAFTDRDAIQRASEIEVDSMGLFRRFYGDLLNEGVYLGPSGYEVGFVSTAHSRDILGDAASRVCEVLDRLFSES
ncbi:glutamate-1-semialdehyde 2,1-aminomutase [Crocinitomix catalasitica]|nr:glutamate-1-semialdehyde 2,1-aminomutase [Crocinitomix catalasitica]